MKFRFKLQRFVTDMTEYDTVFKDKEASPCLKCNDRVVPGPIPCFSESLIKKYSRISKWYKINAKK